MTQDTWHEHLEELKLGMKKVRDAHKPPLQLEK